MMRFKSPVKAIEYIENHSDIFFDPVGNFSVEGLEDFITVSLWKKLFDVTDMPSLKMKLKESFRKTDDGDYYEKLDVRHREHDSVLVYLVLFVRPKQSTVELEVVLIVLENRPDLVELMR